MVPDTDKVFYLASPYSSAPPWYLQDDSKLQIEHYKKMLLDARHMEIQAIAAKLTEIGYILIEPIGSCHYKQTHFSLQGSYDYWKRRDRRLIECSDGIIVAMMPGWDKSVGVTDEIEYAKSLNKEIWYLSTGEQLEFKNDK